jgi:hypothetical protein
MSVTAVDTPMLKPRKVRRLSDSYAAWQLAREAEFDDVVTDVREGAMKSNKKDQVKRADGENPVCGTQALRL